MNYIYSAIGGLILVFILLILRKKERAIADYLLIALNLTLGLFLLSDVLVRWDLNSITLILQNSIPLLLLPIFIFFALQYTHSHRKITLVWYSLFLPLILMLAISIIDHFVYHNYNKSQLILQFNNPSLIYQILFKGSQMLFIIILYYLLKELKSYNYSLKDGYSNTEEIEAKWLVNFTRIYLYALSISFVLFAFQNLGLLSFSVTQVYSIIYSILIFGIFYMTYHGIQHYTLDQVIPKTSLVELNNHAVQNKIALPTRKELTKNEKIIEAQMLTALKDQNLYLNPKISLKDVAVTLNQSTHLVSKIINLKPNRSFYDLINQHRVSHLKQLLLNPENEKLTILALGLESGFNSKASMNRIFKKNTGMSPSEFKRKETT